MWPGPRADSSRTMYLVAKSARSTVSGWPNSLLNDPAGATVGPRRSTSWAARSLVEVFPDDPVMPAIRACGSESATNLASAASAAGTSATITEGTGTGRVPSTATAPAATAAAAKSCPSDRSPATAANSPPGPARRESMTTSPLTTAAGSPCNCPAVIRAICARLSGITGSPPTGPEDPGPAAPVRTGPGLVRPAPGGGARSR